MVIFYLIYDMIGKQPIYKRCLCGKKYISKQIGITICIQCLVNKNKNYNICEKQRKNLVKK